MTDSTGMNKMSESRDTKNGHRLVGAIAILMTTFFCAAAAWGYYDVHSKHGGDGPSGPAAAGVVVVIGMAALSLYIRLVGAFWTDWSARKRRYWTSFGVAALVGGAGAIWVMLAQQNQSPIGQLLNGRLPATTAIGATLLWIGGLSAAMTLYHRSIDDHEERAWIWAGLAGWYAFVLPAPAWWMLHRAALVPPVDAMLLFLASLFVNTMVYLWLKFR